MKNLSSFLREDENPAHKKARAMGLKYRGFGYWANPASGKVEYKTRDGELVPTGGKLETEKGPNDAEPGAPMKSVDSQLPLPNQGNGETIGQAADPGEELAWQPGPDGDTAVGEDNEIVDDVFVPKTNEDNWTAGPDGDNVKKQQSFDSMVSEAMETKLLDARAEAKRRGLHSDGHGRYLDNNGNIVAYIEDNKLVDVDPKEYALDNEKMPATGGGSMEVGGARAAGAEPSSPVGMAGGADGAAAAQAPGQMSLGIDGPFKKEPKGYMGNKTMIDKIKRGSFKDDERTIKDAHNALAGLDAEDREYAIGYLEKTLERSWAPVDSMGRDNQGSQTRAIQGRKKAVKLASKMKDREKVKKLNEDIKQFVADPDYDLYDVGEELGEGAFGAVYEGADGVSVIKSGEIGMEEVKALYVLSDLDQFPAVINAEFFTPFKHQSSYQNNPDQLDDSARNINTRMGKGYFNPDEQSDFEEKFATAKGRFAMSKASGYSLADAQYDYDEESEEFQNFVTKGWQARAAMHVRGIAHNDMHGGNIYVDEDDGSVKVLDLGIAKVDKLAALMEAMAGVSGEDYQLTDVMSRGRMRGAGNPIAGMLEFNHQATLDQIYEDFEDQWTDDMGYAYEELKEGGIRMTDAELEEIQSVFGFSEEQLESYLMKFYEGIIDELDIPGGSQQSDLESRMSKAYDKLEAQLGKDNELVSTNKSAADFIRMANRMRQERGEGAINVKGLDLDRPFG